MNENREQLRTVCPLSHDNMRIGASAHIMMNFKMYIMILFFKITHIEKNIPKFNVSPFFDRFVS